MSRDPTFLARAFIVKAMLDLHRVDRLCGHLTLHSCGSPVWPPHQAGQIMQIESVERTQFY